VFSAEEVIERLGLTPLGFEGGFYRETSRTPYATSIYYLLAPDSTSLMHRLTSDEVYHFYLGDPVEMLLLRPDGSSETVRLGSNLASEQVQLRVPAMTWQGSRLVEGGRFALMGTTMAPGFELAGFELGDRDELLAEFADRAELLMSLTPERIKTDRLELAAATVDLIHAELRSKEALAAGLRATIPESWPPEHHDEATLRWVLERLERGRAQRGWWSWYVVERSTRTAIGIVGLKGPPEERGLAELGYSIVATHRRRGFALESVRALMEWAEARGARRFRGETLPELLPSIGVLEKLGFARVPSDDPAIVRYERDASRTT
jgi:predicted cupin superfamily sugar epimerase/GNAT superfamily N-acetyltransferase